MYRVIVLVVFAALLAPVVSLGTTPDPDSIAKIRDEGMNRSEAMKTIRYLTDVIGPRLTNSPNQRRANQWTKQQLEKWGLRNAVVDSWGEFGRGWELKRFFGVILYTRAIPTVPRLSESVVAIDERTRYRRRCLHRSDRRSGVGKVQGQAQGCDRFHGDRTSRPGCLQADRVAKHG